MCMTRYTDGSSTRTRTSGKGGLFWIPPGYVTRPVTAPGEMARTAGHAVAGDGEGEAAALGTAPVGAGVSVVVLCGDAHASVTERTRRSPQTLSTLGNTALPGGSE